MMRESVCARAYALVVVMELKCPRRASARGYGLYNAPCVDVSLYY